MKLVVGVNLPPKWVEFLATQGIEAVHWSQVGDLRATDSTIMKWARDGGYVVLTSDLDFSAILATSGAAVLNAVIAVLFAIPLAATCREVSGT